MAAATKSERERVLQRLDVSRETAARLDLYVDLLKTWQRVQNLVAPSTLAEVWSRHVLDCGQLVALFSEARIWVDLGSGAGLPGLIVAILLHQRADTHVHLIESNQRKAAFLREAIRTTGVRATVHADRIESVIGKGVVSADMVTARALAPLDALLTLAAPLLKTGAQAAFLKGQDLEEELTQAAKSWRIEFVLIPSLTDERARIVHVRRAEPHSGG
ncbi:MAG: 16S rRNA (guanine(527)-N(7))-methyltransferase RsmG [Labrys sp. (in: a-proteobacteria)]|jgi:16S rRNA (guanine527-N7)-methyltransferase